MTAQELIQAIPVNLDQLLFESYRVAADRYLEEENRDAYDCLQWMADERKKPMFDNPESDRSDSVSRWHWFAPDGANSDDPIEYQQSSLPYKLEWINTLEVSVLQRYINGSETFDGAILLCIQLYPYFKHLLPETVK